jgi:beta-lactamase superfamily II metal-dependent hydrolase
MSDYFEIDFLDVKSSRSGDAIAIRYEIQGETNIHVVDGGYVDTGNSLKEHINKYYNNPKIIDRVVVTHPDGDHANGLRTILEDFTVSELWMLRPWLYAEELLPRFSRFQSVDNLKKRLREIYSSISALEEIAIRKKINIMEPFQGNKIGAFHVLAPLKARYLDLIVESEKTPEAAAEERQMAKSISLESIFSRAFSYIKSAWGVEKFSEEDTSSENEMSVVQFVNFCDTKILLTGDVGRVGLMEAADFSPRVGLVLPGIDRFQVPHHGSRRNVSTEVLDRWLGKKTSQKGEEKFTAIVSSAKEDKDHPRKAVLRAMIHRGAKVITTEGRTISVFQNAPKREGWVPIEGEPYPEDQED